jgi:SAM-dependent methyltransferase
MRNGFAEELRCPDCGKALALETRDGDALITREGALRSPCGRVVPVVAGVPRLLPRALAGTLLDDHPDFFVRHPDLRPRHDSAAPADTVRTLRAFGDEWQRFPALVGVHERLFRWYFEDFDEARWPALRVLDAGCGMGRWLHFARRAGARVVGMDLSAAVDVAKARESEDADFVQADLREPPFADGSFDLVYSLGVLHHLENPSEGLHALARLVRPGGELRLYVYRTLEGEPWWRRALLGVVRALRHLTTRLPYAAVHAVALSIAIVATVLFLWPRRLLRRSAAGDRISRGLPLVQYADVPFRMLVSEQFDRLVAPVEHRYAREEIEGWVREIGFEMIAVIPGLGWRVACRRPVAGEMP